MRQRTELVTSDAYVISILSSTIFDLVSFLVRQSPCPTGVFTAKQTVTVFGIKICRSMNFIAWRLRAVNVRLLFENSSDLRETSAKHLSDDL